MSNKLRHALILIGSVAACSSHTSSHNTSGAGGRGDGGDGGGDEIVCPVSDTGRFETPPSGACTGVGSCAIELDNSCRPGVKVVPTTPAVYECQCISAQWQCAVTSGGLGLTPCGDAGATGQ